MTGEQLDKIKGVFFGQAIGDALGLGTEFLNKQQIASYYPSGFNDYDQIVQDKHRKRWQIGAWTDDTDQFLCICDAILRKKEVNFIAFAEELYSWFKGSPMGIGQTVYKVLTLPQFTQNPHKAAELVWKMSGRKSAANGAIMRTSIVGTYSFWDSQAVIENTENIAKVTHWDARCVGSCVLVTSLIAQMLQSNQLLSAEQLIAIANRYDNRIQEFIELAKSADIETLKLDEPTTVGYTLKALSAGLWAFFHATDFSHGILSVINQGGDADSNAAVAGSLLGAKFGYNDIPNKYIEGLIGRQLLENKFEQYCQLLDL